MKILIVDDDVTLLRTMARGFREHTVLTATNPDKALQLITSEAPDAIISDFDMRHSTNGIELLENVREHQEDIQMVLHTGSVLPASVRDRMATIGAKLASKPSTTAEIKNLIGL